MGLPVLHLVFFLKEPFAVLIRQLRVGPRPIRVASLPKLCLCLEGVVCKVICDVGELSFIDTLKCKCFCIRFERIYIYLVVRLFSARYGSISTYDRWHALSLFYCSIFVCIAWTFAFLTCEFGVLLIALFVVGFGVLRILGLLMLLKGFVSLFVIFEETAEHCGEATSLDEGVFLVL